MIGRRAGAALAALLVAAATGPAAPRSAGPSVTAEGLGPLRLGRPLAEAAAEARALDPLILVGPGCDGREMASLALPASPAPLLAMAMADAAGRIEELRLQPAAAARGESEQRCGERLRDFASALLSPAGEVETRRQPGFRELRLALDGGVALGRWFPAGGSCDVAVVLAAAPDRDEPLPRHRERSVAIQGRWPMAPGSPRSLRSLAMTGERPAARQQVLQERQKGAQQAGSQNGMAAIRAAFRQLGQRH